MSAPAPLFNVLYDVRALTVVHALFALWAAGTGFWLLRHHARARLLLDLAAITVIAAIPRLAFFQKTSFRPAHFFRELSLPASSYSFSYPVGFPALLNLVGAVTGGVADPHEISWYTSLLIGILTPTVFYLLALRLMRDRQLAWTVALLLAFNPAHVMFSGPHDFFIAGVFFEVTSHLLLLVFFQTRRFVFFWGFLLASYLFYQCRTENNVVFYLHALCVLYALWRLPVNKPLMAVGAALFFGVNLAYQFDWYRAGSSDVHVVNNLWRAPLVWLWSMDDPTWNHLVDWRWCPPYLPLLLLAGTVRILRTRSFIHVYPFVIFATFLAVYSDLRNATPHSNARYFLNLIPAVLLVSAEALGWLYQRWERAFPFVVATIVAIFCLYVPRLADNEYITQYEWRFYWTEVRPLVTGSHRVWLYDPIENDWPAYERAQTAPLRIAGAAFGNVLGIPESRTNFRDSEHSLPYQPDFVQQLHLFEDGRSTITHTSAALEPGDYVFLGADCYQFVVVGDRMLPECERQLHDPRNAVVVQADYPARFYHHGAPWVISGAYRNFRTTTFYLLRRRERSEAAAGVARSSSPRSQYAARDLR